MGGERTLARAGRRPTPRETLVAVLRGVTTQISASDRLAVGELQRASPAPRTWAARPTTSARPGARRSCRTPESPRGTAPDPGVPFSTSTTSRSGRASWNVVEGAPRPRGASVERVRPQEGERGVRDDLGIVASGSRWRRRSQSPGRSGRSARRRGRALGRAGEVAVPGRPTSADLDDDAVLVKRSARARPLAHRDEHGCRSSESPQKKTRVPLASPAARRRPARTRRARPMRPRPRRVGRPRARAVRREAAGGSAAAWPWCTAELYLDHSRARHDRFR